MDGEKLWVSCYDVVPRGSPPHGRGKGLPPRQWILYLGITPAWAGKSICLALPITAPRDHPRVGGEKVVLPELGPLRLGSPPRGRGKAAVERVWKQWLGITPAWAGKSPLPRSAPLCCGDHPRVGGEKLIKAGRFLPVGGSPPRGRGKVSICCCASTSARITPAWAGKRSC